MSTPETPPPSEPEPEPPTRWRLFLGIAVAIIAGLLILAAVAFPPRPPVTSFLVIAGIGGTLTFNRTVPGPAMTVPQGDKVTVTLDVDPASSGPHSWMLVPWGGTPASPVVFPGANTTNPTVGLAPGVSQTVTFVASAAGQYKYICGVDSHYLDMWGYFNVTA